jgi:hypothetical protein
VIPRVKGISEKLLGSHYDNNYGGAVNHLNAITPPLAGPPKISGSPKTALNKRPQDRRVDR